LAEIGMTETDESTIAGVPIVIGTGELIRVVPFKDALTKRFTVPAATPAVNVTEAPVLELRLPRELVRVQENVVPLGQVPPEHTTVATKAVLPPVTTLPDDGVIDTATN
jgi:hypothetical protein